MIVTLSCDDLDQLQVLWGLRELEADAFFWVECDFLFCLSCKKNIFVCNFCICFSLVFLGDFYLSLIERARKTVRGSADDIGWLQRAPGMPPVEDGTERFMEIIDDIRYESLFPVSITCTCVSWLNSYWFSCFSLSGMVYTSYPTLWCTCWSQVAKYLHFPFGNYGYLLTLEANNGSTCAVKLAIECNQTFLSPAIMWNAKPGK